MKSFMTVQEFFYARVVDQKLIIVRIILRVSEADLEITGRLCPEVKISEISRRNFFQDFVRNRRVDLKLDGVADTGTTDTDVAEATNHLNIGTSTFTVRLNIPL